MDATNIKKRWVPGIIAAALLATLLAAFLAAAGLFQRTPIPGNQGDEAVPAPPAATAETGAGPSERFKALLEVNPDTVGWIRIPDTRIDYPIVRTGDNDFYLHHDFQGRPSAAGSVFMDFRNNPAMTDMNTILYAHSMADGSMFAGLFAFKDEGFFNQHRILEIDTLSGMTRWEIFSCYVTSPDFYYIHTGFYYPADELAFKAAIAAKSRFPTGIVPGLEDRILTLSTCSYEFQDAYFVIHARKLP